MRTRTIPAAVGLLAIALVGCGNDNSHTEPEKTTPSHSTTHAAPSKADIIQKCTDAVAELPADDNGEVPSEPTPTACASLSDSDYLDAYMAGIQQGNEAAREKGEACLENPTCTSLPLDGLRN